MALHLHIDAVTPADVVVEDLGDHAVFTPKTVDGARWLNTHMVCATWQGSSVVSWSSAGLRTRLRDAGLVVRDA